MYLISQLAERVGLSRTALLYYEKIGLICGRRKPNGYRVYTDRDVQQILLVKQLQAGGLTLQECKACLSNKADRGMMQRRLQQLDEEISNKQASRKLLAALLGDGELKQWHQSLEAVAPEAHLEWLMRQGFSERDALRLRWLSKDMNEHEHYMHEFMQIFSSLNRWGPGSEQDTLYALNEVPQTPRKLLEIGCGNGVTTLLLSQHTQAAITAVDNEATALDRLKDATKGSEHESRIETVCASMTDLPFAASSFDLIWAESCAYIMGVENALKRWRTLLEPKGTLVLSDLVWLTDTPSPEATEFWRADYPDMTSVDKRQQQIQKAGYRTLCTFSLSRQAWDNYIQPLQDRANELREQLQDSAALADVHRELDIYSHYLGEFGYQFFILQKTED